MDKICANCGWSSEEEELRCYYCLRKDKDVDWFNTCGFWEE